MKKIFLLVAVSTLSFLIHADKPTVSIVPRDASHSEITIAVPVESSDAWYQEYLSFSVDKPGVTLSPWKPSNEPSSLYDDTFKETKKIFTQPFTITFTASHEKTDLRTLDAHIHMSYYQRSKKKILRMTFPLAQESSAAPIALADESSVQQMSDTSSPDESAVSSSASSKSTSPAQKPSLSQRISNMLAASDSIAIRLVLALLLGIFLSLTPCIYPMIPITMGILQAQGSRSVGRSFCLASSYTMGIATTFALLGVFAAFTGKLFGSIMSNPFVIITMVGFMAYLAFSMIGLYDMYIPAFLRPRSSTSAQGSLTSAFLFGAVSGTIASPCLSPGLLLLLTLVTATGSIFMGFALLFAFGFGLGLPLLIIGTFSGSLSVLPRAGMWMVEVKQFFGFIMLGTCFYFLSIIVPWHLLLWALAAFALSVGMFYHYAAQISAPGLARSFKRILGFSASAAMPLIAFTAYKAQNPLTEDLWGHNYEQARVVAQNEHKKLLVDISAPYCSICKAIDKKVFCCDTVQSELHNVVPVKIDNIEADETTLALQKKFGIVGVPTVLLIDPDNEQILQRWGSELYDANVDEFAATLRT